jgi:hypothetical protein
MVVNVRIERAGAKPVSLSEPPEVLGRLGRDDTRLNFVVMMERPGAKFFATYLEYTFYRPGDLARTDLLETRVVQWEGIYWNVLTIPAADRAKAEQAANRAELLIKGGSPATIRAEGLADFPLRARNTYTLESVPGAPCYRGQINIELARALENEECDAVVEEYGRTWKSSPEEGGRG